ncbi:MAG TPA: HNH endonuclease family protein [Candidatus Saccharimonadales bacterium]|nr:HNH endonuclease family protein [Candidatus Saccharimonadales bacterium]
MKYRYKMRSLLASLVVVAGLSTATILHSNFALTPATITSKDEVSATLDTLEVKGRAPKTNYSRDQFGEGRGQINGCDTRNVILMRDLTNVQNEGCRVISGTLNDPYTGREVVFTRGSTTGSVVQIDHIVALSDAWQKGAQLLSKEDRVKLANDPLELLAVDGKANQQKSDGDAATWLPSNKSFRCEYASRQIAVKKKYSLWVTEAEKAALRSALTSC